MAELLSGALDHPVAPPARLSRAPQAAAASLDGRKQAGATWYIRMDKIVTNILLAIGRV